MYDDVLPVRRMNFAGNKDEHVSYRYRRTQQPIEAVSQVDTSRPKYGLDFLQTSWYLMMLAFDFWSVTILSTIQEKPGHDSTEQPSRTFRSRQELRRRSFYRRKNSPSPAFFLKLSRNAAPAMTRDISPSPHSATQHESHERPESSMRAANTAPAKMTFYFFDPGRS